MYFYWSGNGYIPTDAESPEKRLKLTEALKISRRQNRQKSGRRKHTYQGICLVVTRLRTCLLKTLIVQQRAILFPMKMIRT